MDGLLLPGQASQGSKILRTRRGGGKMAVPGGYYKLQTTSLLQDTRLQGSKLQDCRAYKAYKAARLQGWRDLQFSRSLDARISFAAWWPTRGRRILAMFEVHVFEVLHDLS